VKQEIEPGILGIWKGIYSYSIPVKYKTERTKEVGFTIKIEQVNGNKFSGTVQDDASTGGTPGTGKIKGRFNKTEIRFDKNMPVYAFIDKQGNHRTNTNKVHPTIQYTGLFLDDPKTIGGVWKFKKQTLIWLGGFIPIWRRNTGTFFMKKE
jgi:hypothetical protein